MIFTLLLSFIAGVVAWTFSEYAMHRFNGHGLKGRTAFSREHLRHHAERNYFTRHRTKVVMATPPVLGTIAIATWLVGPSLGTSFTLGFLLAYVGYEWVHYSLHVRGPRTAYGRMVRRHHFAHHWSCPKHNHGVTSPFWDLAFGTYREPGVIRVPRRQALEWLIDDTTDDIPEALAGDYVLAHGRPRASSAAIDQASVSQTPVSA
jgi:sterol desaturase/sphingolipid hydroxylase (fatty acid hydroxylase superfamily)